MRKFTLLFLLCISILSINLSANAISTDIKKETGYISLNDTVTKEVEPDIATITFAVENTGSTAQKASSENNTISTNIVNALKLITNTDTDTIKTTNFSVRPVYNTIAGKRVIKNYTAVNSLTITTKDISKVAKLIDVAIENGANRTSNLQFGLEDSRKICNDLYPQIVKSLRLQAETLATSAGTSLNGLKHLNVSCNADSIASNGRYYAAKAMNSVSDAEPQTPVEAGKSKIRVYVNADFYVK